MAWTERYCRADAPGGGDGTTDSNSGSTASWTLAEAITNAAAGMRINVKAGLYSQTSTNRTFINAGTQSSPIFWRGFTSTPGDLDTMPTAARIIASTIPHVHFTSGRATISGGYQKFHNIAFTTTSVNNATLSVTGGATELLRCRMENTNAGGSSYALNYTGGPLAVINCYLRSTSSAHGMVVQASRSDVIGCVFDGCAVQLYATNGMMLIQNNYFNNAGSSSIEIAVTNQDFMIIGNTFYSPTNDGILFPASYASSVRTTIINNLFHSITTSGKAAIRVASGTITNVYRFANAFYNVTTKESGFGDTTDPYAKTESSDPFSVSEQPVISTESLSYQNGLPGLFEGPSVSYRSYASIGAAVPNITAGILRHPGMVGGLTG